MPLSRNGSTYVCPHKHSFDIARSGYVNLLQPQDRRSKNPGDTLTAIASRRRLHNRGATEPLLRAISNLLELTAEDVILDAGCGEGFYLGSLAHQTGCAGHGLDISTAAIEAASRRYPSSEWIVANADRFVPYRDQFFSKLISITARMNSAEFGRVLRRDGRLLLALPAPDDLIELRGTGRDRRKRTIEAFAPGFQLIQQHRVTTTAALDASSVADILHSIYRPMQAKAPEAMIITFSLELLLFRPVHQ